jgi:hypothetical protein
VVALNCSQCLVSDPKDITFSQVLIVTYCQEKYYSGNKLITFFLQVAAPACSKITTTITRFLVHLAVLCLSIFYYSFILCLLIPTCSSQKPGSLLTIPFHKLIDVTSRINLEFLHFHSSYQGQYLWTIAVAWLASCQGKNLPANPYHHWSLEEILKAWIYLCHFHLPSSEFPFHLQVHHECVLWPEGFGGSLQCLNASIFSVTRACCQPREDCTLPSSSQDFHTYLKDFPILQTIITSSSPNHPSVLCFI